MDSRALGLFIVVLVLWVVCWVLLIVCFAILLLFVWCYGLRIVAFGGFVLGVGWLLVWVWVVLFVGLCFIGLVC